MSWEDNLGMPMLPAIDVPEHKPVETGLLDRRGQPIRRAVNPIGFHCPRKPRG